MALPLLMLAGTLLRASGPTIVKQLMKMGAKKATKTAIKNAPKNIKTVTSKNIKNIKPVTPKKEGLGMRAKKLFVATTKQGGTKGRRSGLAIRDKKTGT